jgi:hypothetical protein
LYEVASAAEVEGEQQFVHYARCVGEFPVLTQGWVIGEGEARKRGDDDVVRECFGCVFLAKEVHDGEELEERAGPAVKQGDGDSGWV